MSRLGPFSTAFSEGFQHPVLRYIDIQHADRVEVEVVRPKELIGFRSAKLYLYLFKNGEELPPAEYSWDDELNLALVQRQIKAVSVENEKVRFALDLRHRLKRPETRYGDGFFNSVLMILVRELHFDSFNEVSQILPHISTNRPYSGGHSLQDCRDAITSVFASVSQDLQDRLGYPQDVAEDILAGALAKYLDERFTVSDRIRLGWA